MVADTHWPVLLKGCLKCGGDLYVDTFDEQVCHQCGQREVIRSIAKKTIQHPMKRTYNSESGERRICGKCDTHLPATDVFFSMRKDGYFDCYCRKCRASAKPKIITLICPDCGEERQGRVVASKGVSRLCEPCRMKRARAEGFDWGWSAESLARHR